MSLQSASGATSLLLSARAMEMKAPTAFRTISEVATNLEVPQHVLRFWESKFKQVSPLKRGGGRRYYRPEDVALLTSIKDLLYNQGFTIRGVQKLLKEGGRAPLIRASATEAPIAQTPNGPFAVTAKSSPAMSSSAKREIEAVLGELKNLREFLRQSGV